MIELIPDKSRFVKYGTDGKPVAAAQLICDRCSELAGVTEVNGTVCGFGSAALAVIDAEICVLASTGVWYRQSNGAAVSAGTDDDDDNDDDDDENGAEVSGDD